VCTATRETDGGRANHKDGFPLPFNIRRLPGSIAFSRSTLASYSRSRLTNRPGRVITLGDIEYDIAQASSLLVVTADPHTTQFAERLTHITPAPGFVRCSICNTLIETRFTAGRRANKGQEKDNVQICVLKLRAKSTKISRIPSITRQSNPPAAHRAPREVMRPRNYKTGPERIGSSGRIRTYNPPVNRRKKKR
jgi:hypothetical protein